MSLINPFFAISNSKLDIPVPKIQCEKVNQILQMSEPIYCDRGQVLFNERQISRGIYFLYFGKIKEYKHGSDGKEQILRIAKCGDFLGYKGLLTNSRYSVSASVLEEAALSFIPKEEFLNLFENDKTISSYFSQLLSNELVAAENKLVSLAYKPVRGRLAEALLSLEKVYDTENKNEEDGIKISREDLASLVGTAKETVIRLLSEFKSESLICVNGKSINLLNHSGLERINQLYH